MAILLKSGLHTIVWILKDHVFYGVILTAINDHTIDYNLQFYTGLHTNIKLNACYYTSYKIAYCVELQASCYIHCHYPLMMLLFFTKVMSTSKRGSTGIFANEILLLQKQRTINLLLHGLTALFFTNIMLHQIELAQTLCEC